MQKDLFEYIGYKCSSLTQWEVSLPRVDYAVKIAEFLNVSVEYLMTGEDKNIPQFAQSDNVSSHTIELAKRIESLPITYRNILIATLESCESQLSTSGQKTESLA